MLSTGYKMLSTGVTPYPVDIRLYPVDTILISIRGVDSVHIPWTTHIPWVISRGQHVISRGHHVISRGYAPWTTLLPWVTPVENTYPVGTISRGLHVPTGYKVLSTGYDIPWVISRGLNKFNRCNTYLWSCPLQRPGSTANSSWEKKQLFILKMSRPIRAQPC